MFSSAKSKTRHSSSKSHRDSTSTTSTTSTQRSSPIYDGRMSFSDSSTLINVDISPDYPTKSYQPPKYAQVIQEEMLDPEDQAWGSPPPSSYKWSLPKFSRSKKTPRS